LICRGGDIRLKRVLEKMERVLVHVRTRSGSRKRLKKTKRKGASRKKRWKSAPGERFVLSGGASKKV